MEIGRRRLVRAGLFGGLAVLAAGVAGSLSRFLYRRDDDAPSEYRVPAQDVPSPGDEPLLVREGDFDFYLVALRPDGDVRESAVAPVTALNGDCPRESCSVVWLKRFRLEGSGERDVFRCPCCGSAFDRSGERLLGPASRGLETLEVDVRSNGDVVVIVQHARSADSAVARTVGFL